MFVKKWMKRYKSTHSLHTQSVNGPSSYRSSVGGGPSGSCPPGVNDSSGVGTRRCSVSIVGLKMAGKKYFAKDNRRSSLIGGNSTSGGRNSSRSNQRNSNTRYSYSNSVIRNSNSNTISSKSKTGSEVQGGFTIPILKNEKSGQRTV